MKYFKQYGVRQSDRSSTMTAVGQYQTSFRLSWRLRLWRHILQINFLVNSIQYPIKISVITIRIHWLSTNDWTQTAWAADLYTVSRGRGLGKHR